VGAAIVTNIADSDRLERDLGEALGVPVQVAVANEPVVEESLSAAERTILDSLRGASHLDSWLRGRAALKRLLARRSWTRPGTVLDSQGPLEDDRTRTADTSWLSFPHRRFSLTHSGGVAVAAGSTDAAVAGLGVDLELHRTLRPGTERFFLGSHEIAWLRARPAPDRPAELLRLWTVKEALYKANLANRDTLLAQYSLEDAAAHAGGAMWRDEPVAAYRYATLLLEEGVLTVAVRFDPPRNASS
jgi:hypothetical protein